MSASAGTEASGVRSLGVYAAAEANDDIPGVPIAASPIAGYLDATLNADDVYSVTLVKGQVLRASITGAPGTMFDLYLFGPGSTSVQSTGIVAEATLDWAYPDSLSYMATATGTYFLDATGFNSANRGAYTVTYSITTPDAGSEVPGMPAPGSPITGTLDANTDSDDVYALNLIAGQPFQASITGPGATDFDLFLFSPGVSTVWSDVGIVAKAEGTNYPDTFTYMPLTTGTFFLDVYSGDSGGAGAYTVTIPPSATPSLRLKSSSSAPAYAGAITLSATLRREDMGTPVTGSTVVFERLSGTSWIVVGTAVTGADGVAAKSTYPVSRSKTVYRARFAGSAPYLAASTSANVAVTPKTSLGKPDAPTTMYKGRPKAVAGYLKPRHAAGTYPVRVYKYRYVSGVWKSYGYVKGKAANYSTYTKYTAPVNLPYKGKWRLRAYSAADTKHAATWSTFDYVTVK